MKRIQLSEDVNMIKKDKSTWFKDLFGFSEQDYDEKIPFNSYIQSHFIRSKDIYGNQWIKSIDNGRSFCCGKFSTPNLRQLRTQCIEYLKTISPNQQDSPGIHVEYVSIDNISAFHQTSPNACFQVASQFNCLEFPAPNIIPEDGITNYIDDHTQGPACALACAAGTLFRNSFINGTGQTKESQLNNLDDIELLLGLRKFWKVTNGYVFSNASSIKALNARLHNMTKKEIDEIKDHLKIGVHESVGVTLSELDNHCVTQLYCSAISCGYSNIPLSDWVPFASIILEASYEATLWASLSRSSTLYLTLLGGGAFNNRKDWIHNAITKAITNVKHKLQEEQLPEPNLKITF